MVVQREDTTSIVNNPYKSSKKLGKAVYGSGVSLCRVLLLTPKALPTQIPRFWSVKEVRRARSAPAVAMHDKSRVFGFALNHVPKLFKV